MISPGAFYEGRNEDSGGGKILSGDHGTVLVPHATGNLYDDGPDVPVPLSTGNEARPSAEEVNHQFIPVDPEPQEQIDSILRTEQRRSVCHRTNWEL